MEDQIFHLIDIKIKRFFLKKLIKLVPNEEQQIQDELIKFFESYV